MVSPCFDVIAQEFWVAGIGNIFQTNYIPITVNYNRGQSTVFRTPVNGGSTYFHFSADVQGEIYYPRQGDGGLPYSPEDTFQLTRSRGNQVSILKCLLEYPMQNNKIRRLLFDVGSGIDIIIPPTTYVQATLLQPSAEVPDGFPFPAGFSITGQFAAIVVLTAQCVQCPSDHTNHATYTQSFSLSPDSSFVNVDVAPEAKTAQLLASSAVPVGMTFLYQRIDQITNALMDRSIVGNASPIFAGATNTDEVLIPQNANVITYSNAALQTGSIIQRLEW